MGRIHDGAEAESTSLVGNEHRGYGSAPSANVNMTVFSGPMRESQAADFSATDNPGEDATMQFKNKE